MNEKQNKLPCDCRQSTGESKEEASRSQRRHPGEQQTHYYLLWKPSHAWGFLSSGKEWLDMTTQLDTERHTSTDLWGKELKMKYWRHSSVNSPHTLKRLRRQFGLQHYIFFSFPWLLEKVAVKEKCNWTAAYLSVLQLKSIQKEIEETVCIWEWRRVFGGEELRYVYQMEVCLAAATTHVSMLSPSNTVCTGR